MLPQIVEGVATVPVLYVVVRRHAGTGAGLLAAALPAISPATVALERGNVADSLLILLMVCAADATTRATASGRARPLLIAGALVGLAFQAKMIESWAGQEVSAIGGFQGTNPAHSGWRFAERRR